MIKVLGSLGIISRVSQDRCQVQDCTKMILVN
jgi:hypothetical protein